MPKSGANTQKAILDAANRIVIGQGVERLTLEQVAAEAGISKGGLLYHFPTKEALIKAMISHYLERFTQDFFQAAEKKAIHLAVGTTLTSPPPLPIISAHRA